MRKRRTRKEEKRNEREKNQSILFFEVLFGVMNRDKAARLTAREMREIGKFITIPLANKP